ncbi:5-methylcytosine restriction system specificity protein McrC [Paraburkholderia sp. RL17-381-BIF-C]|uniref:5-methylcytosine restriction system specificity protein McrC n=1 Tax=Paraburkholderia sp. RL17-381-BIF-C TaxID=3031635 RepID=UPI0038B85996
MQTKLRISLRERGEPQVVSPADWMSAGCADDATALARLGVLKVTRSDAYVLLEPKTLVGVFDSPRLLLEVLPKAPVLSAGLLQRLNHWRKSIDVDDPSKVGVFSDSVSLWKSFELLLTNLHSEGLPWSYARKTDISSAPRGRVLFRETLTRLAARGINHQLVANIQVRDHFNCFAPALDTVRRRLVLLENAPPEVRSRVVRLISLIADISVPVSEDEARSAFKMMAELEGRPSLDALLRFCLQILDGDRYYRHSQRVGSGIAEFVDLEKLWENAIQMLLMQHSGSVDDRVLLHPLRRAAITLFEDGGPEIDPDIVSYRGSFQHAIVDAKYSIATSPSAADVYQMTAYLSRLKCQVGLLAYVAQRSETEMHLVGTLGDGRKLFACYLTLDAFDSEFNMLRDILSATDSISEMV